ncbi:MAG: hypothetical protein HEP71_06565 [Roseivirga sp.]|nr:hypothetical protein [Roseivirga sp.]
MEKSDKSKKSIIIAKIERSYIPPFDFEFTGIFNEQDSNFPKDLLNEIALKEEEELICSTYVNDQVWTLLTTRRILSREGLSPDVHSIKGIKKWHFGDFKGYSKQPYTKGFLFFEDDKTVPVFIETGRASMVMVNGIMTLNQIE